MADSPGLFTLQTGFTRALTIDHTQVPSTQSDFPILVNFTDATFKTTANGGHINTTNAFTFSSDSAGASLLKWEVERYDATAGEIVAWVKIASVSSVSDTVFYLKYGGAILTDQSDPTNVWDANFKDVFHMKDGTTLSLKNSKTGNNGVATGSPTAAAGQIDGCGGFVSASSQYISSDSSPAGDAATISAWIKATSFPGAYNCPGGLNNGSIYVVMLIKSNGKLAPFTWRANYDGTGSHTLVTGTWYYVAMTYDNSAGLIGYVNAASDGTAAAGGTLNLSAISNDIGKDSVNGRYWDGSIDEFRFSIIARSPDWITIEYANQKPSANLVALGGET